MASQARTKLVASLPIGTMVGFSRKWGNVEEGKGLVRLTEDPGESYRPY